MATLQERFVMFLEQEMAGESIDRLHPAAIPRHSKRADYFLSDRRVIVEVKSICDPRENAIKTVLDGHSVEPDWPVSFQDTDIQGFLKSHPRRDAINRELSEAATTSIEGLYRNANRQIRETKAAFDLPSASGLFVLLNEIADVLDPIVLTTKLQKLAQKKDRRGRPRFQSVEYALVVPEAHVLTGPGSKVEDIVIALSERGPEDARAREVLDPLISGWARSKGKPVRRGEEVKTVEHLRGLSIRGRRPPLEY